MLVILTVVKIAHAHEICTYMGLKKVNRIIANFIRFTTLKQ